MEDVHSVLEGERRNGAELQTIEAKKKAIVSFIEEHKSGIDNFFKRFKKEFPHAGNNMRHFIFGSDVTYNLQGALDTCQDLMKELKIIESRLHNILAFEGYVDSEQKKIKKDIGYMDKKEALIHISNKLSRYGVHLKQEIDQEHKFSQRLIESVDKCIDALTIIKKLLSDSISLIKIMMHDDQRTDISAKDIKIHKDNYSALNVNYHYCIHHINEFEKLLMRLSHLEKIYLKEMTLEMKTEKQIEKITREVVV